MVIVLFLLSPLQQALSGEAIKYKEKKKVFKETGSPLAALPPPGLVVSWAEVTLNIEGQDRSFNVLHLGAARPQSILLGGAAFNGLKVNYIYIVLDNKTANAYPYIGKLLYHNGTGWNSFSVSSPSSETELTGKKIKKLLLSSTVWSTPPLRKSKKPFLPQQLLHLQYNTTRTEPYRPQIINLTVSGEIRMEDVFPFDQGFVVSGTEARVLMSDGYNPSTGQGGIWEIISAPNLYSAVLGNEGVAVLYHYYKSIAGPLSGIPSQDIPHHSAIIGKINYKSPAGVRLAKLEPQTLSLQEEPGYISFSYACYDSDPLDDLFFRGKLSMKNGEEIEPPTFEANEALFIGSYVPVYIKYEDDDCESGTLDPYTTNLQSALIRSQASCSAEHLPMMQEGYWNCPTPSCAADKSGCASLPVTYTCADSDGGVQTGIAGEVTIISSTGEQWIRSDYCGDILEYTEGVGQVITENSLLKEYYCAAASSSTNPLREKVIKWCSCQDNSPRCE